MREIKFRAWDQLEKRMWTLEDAGENSGDGSIQYFSENGSLEFGRLEFYDTGLGVNSNFTKFPLMQYTGLKDKDGREIYEGDIVEQLSERTYESVKGTVKFIDGSYLIEFLSGDNGVFLFDEVAYNEVLGNVYENPTLLEELQNGTK